MNELIVTLAQGGGSAPARRRTKKATKKKTSKKTSKKTAAKGSVKSAEADGADAGAGED